MLDGIQNTRAVAENRLADQTDFAQRDQPHIPAMRRLLVGSPDINVEITVDYGLADVVADRFDAGVRLGREIARDMIAVRIGPDIPMAIVGSPEYFRDSPMPTSPAQLIDHRAINLRLPTSGTVNAWRLKRGGREARVRVDGQLVLNTIDLILDAALDGHGLAYLPLDQVSTVSTPSGS
ncbi:DNA-binding transcriptional LysR family regulator [Paraburkholderia sp. WSM4175]|uniref:LysR substrate-binding domain-containing protein n=1 Tax=Paraburkholderia sp. WSM4175 TaxID=2991072 RepID=UPI003D1DBA9E